MWIKSWASADHSVGLHHRGCVIGLLLCLAFGLFRTRLVQPFEVVFDFFLTLAGGLDVCFCRRWRRLDHFGCLACCRRLRGVGYITVFVGELVDIFGI